MMWDGEFKSGGVKCDCVRGEICVFSCLIITDTETGAACSENFVVQKPHFPGSHGNGMFQFDIFI